VPNNQATVTDHVGPDQALLAYHQPPQCLLQPGLPDLGGFIAGVVFWGAFNTALELTNTEQFCTGCHEMRDNVYQELQGTIHFTNRSGVRAKCSDCHVPHNWTDKMARKMQASKEVWAKIFGTVDTREKFQAHRLELAQHEWARFKANDSLECRNCHDYQSMDFTRQSPRAQAMHSTYLANKEKTCIDCHKGSPTICLTSPRPRSNSLWPTRYWRPASLASGAAIALSSAASAFPWHSATCCR
jgi:cytochrome c-type protein NapC